MRSGCAQISTSQQSLDAQIDALSGVGRGPAVDDVGNGHGRTGGYEARGRPRNGRPQSDETGAGGHSLSCRRRPSAAGQAARRRSKRERPTLLDGGVAADLGGGGGVFSRNDGAGRNGRTQAPWGSGKIGLGRKRRYASEQATARRRQQCRVM